jgi:hypothetical protein
MVKKLYVRGEIPDNLEDFLRYFFSHPTNPYVFSIPTYNSKSGDTIHCKNKYRSFDDIYRCCATYFDVTEKDVMKALLDITPKSNSPIFGTCGTMQKLKIYYYKTVFPSSVAWDSQMLYSKHTWRQLLNMVGIKSDEDLKKYLDGRRNRKQVPSKVHA